MSSFQCTVVRVEIEPHPNADAIELARVGGFLSIVKKGDFGSGDLAVYIPEQAVLPEWLLKRMGFWDEANGKGKLSGSAGDRVRAMRLRGVLSQGLLLRGQAQTEVGIVLFRPVSEGMGELYEYLVGTDAADFLGIVKYEPKVPTQMEGRVAGIDLDATLGYDFENIKKIPDLFDDGMEVVMTEKLHGTLLQVGLIPRAIWMGKAWADKCPDFGNHGYKGIVTSKGQGARGILLDPSDTTNLYVKAAFDHILWGKLDAARAFLGHPTDTALFMFAEIFGTGVQDLGYGQAKPVYRVFDMYAGTRSNGFYLSHELLCQCAAFMDAPLVPQLYLGPFDPAAVALHTNGKSVIGGDHTREGVVVKATSGDLHPIHGRRIAKSVSEAYLLRRGNITEYS